MHMCKRTLKKLHSTKELIKLHCYSCLLDANKPFKFHTINCTNYLLEAARQCLLCLVLCKCGSAKQWVWDDFTFNGEEIYDGAHIQNRKLLTYQNEILYY